MKFSFRKAYVTLGIFFEGYNFANRVTNFCGVESLCHAPSLQHAFGGACAAAANRPGCRARKFPLDSVVREFHSGTVLVSSNPLLNPLRHCLLM